MRDLALGLPRSIISRVEPALAPNLTLHLTCRPDSIRSCEAEIGELLPPLRFPLMRISLHIPDSRCCGPARLALRRNAVRSDGTRFAWSAQVNIGGRRTLVSGLHGLGGPVVLGFEEILVAEASGPEQAVSPFFERQCLPEPCRQDAQFGCGIPCISVAFPSNTWTRESPDPPNRHSNAQHNCETSEL